MGDQLFPIVKAADEAISQVGNATTPLSTSIGSTLADVWQGIVGDRVAAWRVRNAAGIHEQLTTYVVEKNLSLDFSRIPEGFAFTWFEQATTHEEPEVQQLFATILANAALGNDEAFTTTQFRNSRPLLGLRSEADTNDNSTSASEACKFQQQG